MIDKEIFKTLDIESVRWYLSHSSTANTTRGGAFIPSRIGDSLWRGDAILSFANNEEIRRTEAILSEISQVGRFFLVHDPRYYGPFLDRSGLILGEASPEILTVDSSNRFRIRISDLPPNYGLSVGDYFSFSDVAQNVYSLHRITSAVTSNSVGTTGFLTVVPEIRAPSLAIGRKIELIQPSAKCAVRVEYGTARTIVTEGHSIEFVQTLV